MNAAQCLLFVCGVFICYASCQSPNCPTNIILVIGDGMGQVQEQAAELFLGRPVAWKDAPYKATVKTASTSVVTDSAAAGTAMSTGVTVDNDVVSLFLPGNQTDITTSLEFYNTRKRTGIVTSTHILHATPATFAAHDVSRDSFTDIFLDYLVSKPNIIFGGGKAEVNLPLAVQAGYSTATTKTAMNNFVSTDPHVIAVFGQDNMPYEFDESSQYTSNDWPHLSEMAAKAIDLLSQNNPDGFFLMIECGRIDHAGHERNINRNVYETVECDKMFQLVKTFASSNQETLVVVTADHETGGLRVVRDNGVGNIPNVSWSTGSHTATDVNIVAYGPWAQWINGTVLKNEQVFDLTYYSLSECSFTPTPTPSNTLLITQSVTSATTLSTTNTALPSPRETGSMTLSVATVSSTKSVSSPSTGTSSTSHSGTVSSTGSSSVSGTASVSLTSSGTTSHSGTISSTGSGSIFGTASISPTGSGSLSHSTVSLITSISTSPTASGSISRSVFRSQTTSISASLVRSSASSRSAAAVSPTGSRSTSSTVTVSASATATRSRFVSRTITVSSTRSSAVSRTVTMSSSGSSAISRSVVVSSIGSNSGAISPSSTTSRMSRASFRSRVLTSQDDSDSSSNLDTNDRNSSSSFSSGVVLAVPFLIVFLVQLINL